MRTIHALLVSVAASALLSAPILAAAPAAVPAKPAAAAAKPGTAAKPPESPLPRFRGAPKTRQEAMDRQKQTLAALEKMTDEQWNAMMEDRKARQAKRRTARAVMANKKAAAPAQTPVPAQAPAPAR